MTEGLECACESGRNKRRLEKEPNLSIGSQTVEFQGRLAAPSCLEAFWAWSGARKAMEPGFMPFSTSKSDSHT